MWDRTQIEGYFSSNASLIKLEGGKYPGGSTVRWFCDWDNFIGGWNVEIFCIQFS